jgi:hypothetical protein
MTKFGEKNHTRALSQFLAHLNPSDTEKILNTKKMTRSISSENFSNISSVLCPWDAFERSVKHSY